ncbi:substrate import-associated zinc metallohydrolase lipoprotein [Sphingobacterium suaedae]|uniref:Substrate import-associated zinc metallohydrolase lipoprotein n=1 Tax=Sphingobacterium suaedae TaxID=1686402 RepID=A0ABW5KKB5_9SPHI
MKKRNLILPLLVVLTLLYGCKKEDDINFEFDNSQDFVPTELDEWLDANFLNTYNIEVVYRYDRYKGNIERNITPVKEEKVKGQMLVVLDGFLKPYDDVAGTTFIKTFTPKEWVLFGSTSYNDDGSMILGTAAGGRNVTLYEVNSLDNTDAEQVRRRLRTIHHEFTHILQQNKTMPLDFEGISEGDYFDDWTNTTLNPQKLSDSLGFVSRYARSQYFEDFAETAAHLLMEGQLWYDHHAKQYNKITYDRLKKKETSVVNYFRDSHNIDFRKLQRELQSIMYEQFNDKVSQSLGNWLLNKQLFVAPSYNAATVSTDFKASVDVFKEAVYNYHSTNRYQVQDIRFLFNSADKTLIVRVPFRGTGGSNTTTVYEADYNFAYAYNTGTEKVTFTKTAQGEGARYNNANLFMDAFMDNIGAYLTGSPFVLDWSLTSPQLSRKDEGYNNTGGFYKENNRNSFMNFVLERIKF